MTRPAEIHALPAALFGDGVLQEVGHRCRGWSTDALVVTDPGLRAAGIVTDVERACARSGVTPHVFDKVTPNPTVGQVEAGLAFGSGRDVGVIVSVGGGSAHDCAKVIALVAANGGRAEDYVGVDRSAGRGLPVVAVNTTAGSGADVSRFAVITGEGSAGKLILADRHLMPRLSVNDPRTTIGLPREHTVASGLDALTHAIEAYVSTAASPVTDPSALRAITLVAEHLERAADHGDDLQARLGMLHAAHLAAVAFNSASVGAVHALAHAVGGAYDLPHGVCNGILLPVVSQANLDAARERYADIAQALGVRGGAHAAIRRMRDLGRRLGLPRGLGALGVDRDRLPALAAVAVKDLCMDTNPRPLDVDDVVRLYEEAL